MIKRLLFSALLACGLGSLFAQPSLEITYAQTSLSANCPTPVSGNFYLQATTYVYALNDSVDCYIDFGDGNDTLQRIPIYYNSAQPGYVWFSQSHTFTNPGIYTSTYIVTGPDGFADTSTQAVVISNSCNNVTGRLYVDNNSDCSYNTGDQPLQYQYLDLLYNNQVVETGYTDNTGHYQLSAAPGYTYTIRPHSNGLLSFPCLSGADSIQFALATSFVGDFPAANTNGFSVDYYGDSSYYYCTTPAQVYFYCYGSCMGYNAGVDTMTIYMNFGDGHDTLLSGNIYTNNAPLESWSAAYVNHTYLSPGNYNVEYIVTAPDGQTDTIISVNEVMISGSCGNLEGHAYLDNNSNCVFDAGDSVLSWVPVSVTYNNNYAAWTYTDANGYYNVTLYPGTYTVALGAYTNYTFTCPASGYQSATVTSSSTTTADFGMTCPTGTFDLSADLWAWRVQPGSYGYLDIYAANHDCQPVNATLKVLMDPMTHYVGPLYNTPAPTVSGDTLIWNLPNLSGYWYYWNYWNWFAVEFTTDSTVQIGDTACFTAWITPTTGDANVANNTDNYCIDARASWDPNSKQVTPEGIGANHDVAPQTDFEYTIHFQNTGTAPAMNILVTDTLDADLDLSTFQAVGSSHFMQPDVQPGNVVVFQFPNINLPDSASDPVESQGWVTFRIAAKPNLANGTPINNTANIYFDFNPAVITNTTLNTINTALSVEEITPGDATVYPNPASTAVIVSFDKPTTGNYFLYDFSGKEIATGSVNGTTASVDVSNLPEGIYMLTVQTPEGRSVHKIMVQR